MDILHKALKWVSYNRGVAAMGVVGVALSIALVSCVPKTPSILHPGVKVDAAALEREVAEVQADFDSKAKAAELATEDLQRQYELRQQIVGIIGGVANLATTGALNPSSAVAGVLQLLTLSIAAGAVYDNRRKDKIIAGAGAAASSTAEPG